MYSQHRQAQTVLPRKPRSAATAERGSYSLKPGRRRCKANRCRFSLLLNDWVAPVVAMATAGFKMKAQLPPPAALLRVQQMCRRCVCLRRRGGTQAAFEKPKPLNQLLAARLYVL